MATERFVLSNMNNGANFIFSIALGAASIFASAARADTFVVDRSSDSCSAQALTGSLRAAILAANATPGSDSITFDKNLSGQTIQLCECLPPVEGAITFAASAFPAPLTLDAGLVSSCEVLDFERGGGTITGSIVFEGRGASARVFHVGPQRSLTLDGVTVRSFVDPFGRGVIYNEGFLKIVKSNLEFNVSTLGGAIYASGARSETTLIDTALRSNSAPNGGAIYLRDGRMSLASVELDQNRGNAGAGIFVHSGVLTVGGSAILRGLGNEGTALYLFGGKTIVSNSKITQNTARSGAAVEVLNGALELQNSSVDKNAGQNCKLSGSGAIIGRCVN